MAVDGSRHDETSLEFDAEVESRTQSSNLLAAPRLYLPVACMHACACVHLMQAPFLELDDLPEANGIELAEQPSRHARAVSAPLRACAFPHLKGRLCGQGGALSHADDAHSTLAVRDRQPIR